MMLISHDLSVLADMCDRIAVMYGGRIVEQGPADQVFTDAAAPLPGGAVARRSRGSATRRRGTPRPGSRGDPPDPRELPPAARSTRAARSAVERVHDRRAALLEHRRAAAHAACIRVGEP